MSLIRLGEAKASWLLSQTGLKQSIPVVCHQAHCKPQAMDCLVKRCAGPQNYLNQRREKLSNSSAGATTKQKRHISESTKQMHAFF